jgi:hypothetical protein
MLRSREVQEAMGVEGLARPSSVEVVVESNGCGQIGDRRYWPQPAPASYRICEQPFDRDPSRTAAPGLSS